MSTLSPVVATQRIDGTILPGTIFTPASEEQLADLQRLEAVREPTEAELLLHEKMQANKAAAETPAPSKPTGGRGRRAAATQTPAATGGEAGNGEAGNGAEGGEAGNGENAENGEAGNGENADNAEANIG
jgi:hypothetical protein